MAGAGSLSLVWGVLLLLWPMTGALVLALWVGAYMVAFGLLMTALSLRLRGRCHRGDRTRTPAAAVV